MNVVYQDRFGGNRELVERVETGNSSLRVLAK